MRNDGGAARWFRGFGLLCVVLLGLGSIVGSGGGGGGATASGSFAVPAEGAVLSIGNRPIATFAPNTVNGSAAVRLELTPKEEADSVSANDITLSIPANQLTLAEGGKITLNFYASDIQIAQGSETRERATALPSAIDPTQLFAHVVIGGKAGVSFTSRVVSGAVDGVYSVGLSTLQLASAAMQSQQQLLENRLTAPLELAIRVTLWRSVDDSKSPRMLYRWTGKDVLSAVTGEVTATAGKLPLILVHGIDAIPSPSCGSGNQYRITWNEFAQHFFTMPEASAVRDKFDLYTFQYPSSQSIKSNGLMLARKIFEHFGNRPVVIVSHSMGGLVTRAADVLYSKGGIYGDKAVVDIDIRRVITLDTPHRGVPWVDDGASLTQALCLQRPDSHQGAADLRWDGMDTGKCDSVKGNPLLCDETSGLNVHLGHLKKYSPYSSRFSVPGLPSAEALRAMTLADLMFAAVSPVSAAATTAGLAIQWCKDSPHGRYCFARVVQIASQAWRPLSARSDGDGVTLVNSQRLQKWTGTEWRDHENMFASYRDTFEDTDHSGIHDDEKVFRSALIPDLERFYSEVMPKVTSLECTVPTLGLPFTCSLVGENLPDRGISLTATNCLPGSMTLLESGTPSLRRFGCVPAAQGPLVITSLTVPGLGGVALALPTFVVAPAPVAPVAMIAPTLLSPIGNPTLATLTPTLQWQGGTANFWQVNIRNLATNALTPSAALAASQTSYVVPAGVLVAGAAYRWDVTACPDTACNDPATFRVSANGYFTASGSPPPATPAPAVAAIACPSPVAGQPMTCVLTGSNLSATNVGARSQLCGSNSAMALVAASSTQGTFSCPSPVAGLLPVEAIRTDTNAVIFSQTVLVVAPQPAGVPTVSAIDCGSPVSGQVMTCRVAGTSLTSSNINLSTPVCSAMVAQAPGAATLQSFTCTTYATVGTSFTTSTVTARRTDTASVLRTIAIRLAPTPQAEVLEVKAIGCSNAVVNQLMTCTLSGTGLTDTNYTIDVFDTFDLTQTCSNVLKIAGMGTRQRSFTCVPLRANQQDVRIWPAQGAGILRAVYVTVQPAAMPERFREDFSSASLNSAVWTNYGSSITLGGGAGTFGAASVATTKGRVNVVGNTLVVEARFAGPRASTATTGRDSYVSLVDAYTGDTISFGDASYQREGSPVGMYVTGAGAFGLRQSGNGASTSAYKEYRLTVAGSTVLLERGDTLANITERLAFALRAPAGGRLFYLRLGTGSADFAPTYFDWVSIRSDRSDLPGPLATFFLTAEGIWQGTLLGGTRTAQAFVLDTGEYWFLYKNTSNSDFGGFLQGTDTGVGGSFSAYDSKEASVEGLGSVTDRWVTGTYVPKQSLSGQVLNPATAVATSFAMTNYLALYETPADLGVVAGAFTGKVTVAGLPSEVATMSVSTTGRLTGASVVGCGFDGYAVPRPKGNLFDVTLTFQGGSCVNGTATVTGIGYYDAATRSLYGMAANSARTGAFLFTGSK